ncbi:MAG: Sua5/YciO/YrdC/YwlC family protein, partial [Alphaproteobacteria bacterium]
RRKKHREEKPLALMSPDIANIRRFAHVTTEEETLLASAQRPIVLLQKKAPNPGDGWALHACVLRGTSGGKPT